MIGLSDKKEFDALINKRAIAAYIATDMEWQNDFRNYDRQGVTDWKLSRMACYMIVMNADPNIPQVAEAQFFFASMTEQFLATQAPEEIDRLIVRREVSEATKSLNSTAKQAGVIDFGKFTTAGYLGMYNMYHTRLAKQRNVPSNKLMDYMGRSELAANLFRATMTEEKIKLEKLQGQKILEDAHKEVGSQVRKMVKLNTGKNPEDLPVRRELPGIKKNLKSTKKHMSRLEPIRDSQKNEIGEGDNPQKDGK